MRRMRLSPLFWLLVLLALCLSPLDVKAHLHTMGRLHQSYHVVAFFVTGCLLAWPQPSWRYRAAMLSLVASFAFLTEWLEHAVWHNAIEWRDMYTDLTGVTLALLAMLFCARAATRREQSLQPTLL